MPEFKLFFNLVFQITVAVCNAGPNDICLFLCSVQCACNRNLVTHTCPGVIPYITQSWIWTAMFLEEALYKILQPGQSV